MMNLTFQPIQEVHARTFLDWRYEPPYDVYNIMPDEVEAEVRQFLDPDINGYAILDEQGELAACCTFGKDGQVPGGDYSAPALDIGLGVRPDLTGHGLGGQFVQAVLAFAQETFAPTTCRVTIATFNQRARRVWERVGFQPVQTFTSTYKEMPFVILVKDMNDD